MKKILLVIILFLGVTVELYSQEDGVVSLTLPIRNSLKFNKFIINPTFSFVREQNAYVSFYNKRQWVQFDNAPQTYLLSYSGRFRENEGIAIGVFQQNYGVLTTFGGVANFAHNIMLQEDSNITFGMNLSFYKSGINTGKIITNYPDPSLENIPSSSLIAVNPGINYGTAFLDFGLSINNLFLYNLKTSKLVEEDPEKSIEIHVMHTGYIEAYGFFDRAKFSGLLKTELKKDKTIISGLAMLSIPKGFWAQAGYNSLYGISGGLGLNITPKISLEYNYEKGTGNLTNFGSTHEIVFAYKFKSKNYYYADDDDEGALIPTPEVKRTVVSKPKTNTAIQPKPIIDTKAKLAADAKLKADALAKEKLAADAKLKADALAKEKLAADAKLKADALAKEKLAADTKLKADALAKEKLAADAKLKADALAQEKLAADAKLKADALAQEKLAADAKLKADALAQEKLAADAKLKADALAQEKLAADAKLKADALAQEKLAADAKIKSDSIAKANLPKDDYAKSMDNIAISLENAKKVQEQLLDQLNLTVSNKQKDLLDLKEENDLSEKGIFKEPKAFKSVTAENNALETLKSEIAEANKTQNNQIKELETLYNERIKKGLNKNESLNQYYLKTIETLKKEQLKAVQSNTNMISSLEKIKIDTEIEKKRRIKKAVFVNDQQRHTQDVSALKRIKETTKPSETPLQEADFDYGEEQANMQILKSIKNVESGYYLIVAVHDDVEKRDSFLTKTVASGQSNIDFFYDANTSRYFIYYDKFDTIEQAKKALQSKGNKPYNGKMTIVKIEN